MDRNEIPSPGYDGYRELSSDFIDGKTFDAKGPIGYINTFEIGYKDDEKWAGQ